MKGIWLTRVREKSFGELILSAPAVAIYLIGLALILYQRAWNFGFNSDAFVLLANAIKNPLAWDHTYHYMPITASWLWLQYQVFGMHQAAYEILNIIQHGIMGWLVFLLGIRLNFGRSQSFLAGLFFVCAGSAYQVALWSVVGSNYFLSGCFYLGGLILFIRTIRREKSALIWGVTFLYALALLAHEQTATLLPVCLLYALLCGGSPSDTVPQILRQRKSYIEALRRVAPLLIPLGAFLAMKYYMALHTSIMVLYGGPLVLYQNILKGIYFALSFRGYFGFAHRVIHFWGGGALTLLWLAPFSIVMVFLLRRGRAIEVFLALWTLGQLLTMDLAIGIAIRHLYLPTVATSLLVVSIGARMAHGLLDRSRVQANIPISLPAQATLLFGLLAIPIFFAPSIKDLQKAQDYWKQADTATRNLEQRLITLSSSRPDISKLTILDATKHIRSPGFEIYTFQNGLTELVALLTPGRFQRPFLAQTRKSNIANSSQQISASTLDRLLQREGMGILRFDPSALDFHLLRPQCFQSASDIEPEKQTSYVSSESRPALAWQKGASPSLDIPPHESISEKISAPAGPHAWIFVRSLNGQGDRFRIGIRGEFETVIQAQGKALWRYHSRPIPRWLESGIVEIFVRNLTSKHLHLSRLGVLPERTHYSGGTTPEFEWNSKNALEINPGTALRLPLAPCEGSDCRLILTWLALPGHDIKVRTSTGLKEKLKVLHRLQKKWQTPVLLQGAWARGHIELQAIGKLPAQIRQVRGFHLTEHPELLNR